MEKPPSPFETHESSGMDREIAGCLAEAADAATSAKRLWFLFSTALEMRKRLDLPEEQLVRWGEIARRCAVNPMADVDLIAAGFAAGYADAARNPALPFYLLEDPSAKRLFEALIRQHGLEAFADAEMPPDVLEQVWRLAMERQDVPWGAAGLLVNPRIPAACLEDAKRRVEALPSRSVGAAASRCLEGLVLRPDQDLASRRDWMRRIVADDPHCGDVCADLASSFDLAGRAPFVDPELFRLLYEGLERGLEEQGNIEAWCHGRDALESALKDRRSGGGKMRHRRIFLRRHSLSGHWRISSLQRRRTARGWRRDSSGSYPIRGASANGGVSVFFWRVDSASGS